jgi:hypothetical protein
VDHSSDPTASLVDDCRSIESEFFLHQHIDQQWHGDEECHNRRSTTTGCSSDRHATDRRFLSGLHRTTHLDDSSPSDLSSSFTSRLDSIRVQARDCLSKCRTILGKRYFKFIVEELIADLQRGYQHFVLLHTIHSPH